MNIIFSKHISFLLSLTVLSVVGSGLPAQAEMLNQDVVDSPVIDALVKSASPSTLAEQTQPEATQASLTEQVELEAATQQVEPTAPKQEVASNSTPIPGTTTASAADLTTSGVTPQTTEPAQIDNSSVAQVNVDPGQATQGGSSYIGIGGNIGLGGESAVGDESFVILSKLGITNRISVRPSVLIEDDPVILLPVTYDFSFNPVDAFAEPLPVAPYVGVGVGIETSDDSDVGFLVTGGVDFPITSQFTATAAINAVIDGDSDVGLLLGIGYNFGSLF